MRKVVERVRRVRVKTMKRLTSIRQARNMTRQEEIKQDEMSFLDFRGQNVGDPKRRSILDALVGELARSLYMFSRYF